MGKGTQQQSIRKVTLDEVKKHRTPDDAWMVFKGKVYDVSNWFDHPGGQVIFTHAGEDFTDIFAAFHPPSAFLYLQQFYIADIDEDHSSKDLVSNEGQKKFMESYRTLRQTLKSYGMFDASYAYYVMKTFSNLLILAGAWFCVLWSSTFWVHMLGAFLVALFWQQCGWLSHDFLHHQVFQKRLYGDLVGIFLGNICQGFSVAWWKNKHNTHHAVPNLHESSFNAHDGDPDIDTMPFLAWSLNMAKKAQETSLGMFFVRYQAILYFPILLIARISWAIQSLLYVIDIPFLRGIWETKQAFSKKIIQYPIAEPFALLLHYLWYFLMIAQLPVLHGLCFFLLSQTACGFLLALVFGLGHNGMATYEANARPDFWKLQVTTTRNITPNLFVNWFCGGLQYQVDHHLFPTVPRHHLKQVHKYVEEFCKDQGVKYHETGMYEGTLEVLSHLRHITEELVAHFPAM